MVIYTDEWGDDGGAGTQHGWGHELLVSCFSEFLGAPFEREALDRDDEWIRYKVRAAGEVVNANLILDYGRDAGNGDWEATNSADADYLAFTFACQLWLDYPTPLEIKAHVDTGLVALTERMKIGEGGTIEDKMDGGRRKIYFEREGLFDLSASEEDVKRAALNWAETAFGDVAVAAESIIYSE